LYYFEFHSFGGLVEDKTLQQSEALSLLCPTCGARYTLPKYVEGQKYGCKRCSASLMFGKFALQQELGRGGFGVVYKAFQADLQRIVALKFLHTDSEESTERFMREARIAANLSHPNITAIYEVGKHEGKPYITMQFVDGITTNKATLSIREAVAVVRDASTAVDYAHARDVIHRDLKPHNIMVTSERSGTSPADMNRRTFVMDFGLARSASRGGTLTTEGQVMGTPAFMSPEQAEGRTCDTKSDVYSLGATLYSLVAKRPPFDAPTPLQILMQVTQEEPRLPSEINPEIDKGLEAIIMKAMAKDPAERYPSASRFAQDLTSWLAGGVTDAGPTVRLTPATRRAAQERKKKGMMVGLGLVLIIAGAAGLAWRITSQPPREQRPPGPSAPPVVEPVEAAKPVPAVPKVLLDVRTDPPDATLRVENREWKTPIVLNETQLIPGTYEVAISKPGFQTITERVTLTAGQATVVLDKKLARVARKVAFTVASDPAGAKILLNGTDTGALTPNTVYEDEVGGAVAQVELELDGYLTAKRSIEPTGEVKRIVLTPKTGSFVVTGAAPGATVLLLTFPSAVKNPRAVAGLWSENAEQLEQAVASLDAADVPFVVERLKALTTRAEPKVRERAAKLAGTPGCPTPVKAEKTVSADGLGGARLENAWVNTRYRILATSPRTLDFLSDVLEPRTREEISLKVDMTAIATVAAAGVRPAVGRFKVVQADGNVAGSLAPGGPAVRVTAGPVTLQYQPPSNDPILREFALDLRVSDRYELAGSLYQYCGEAYERERNVPMAMRSYQKLLEEKQFPTGEQPERAKLPERMRLLYRGWIDEAARQGKPAGADAASRLEEARRKDPTEAAPLMMELYAAKDATPEARGAAAVALARTCAKLAQPYEAVEWFERSVRDKIDPGRDAAGEVLSASRGFPGLAERMDAALAAVDALRKEAQAKADPVPVPVPPAPPPPPAIPGVGKKAGSFSVVNRFGLYVALEPNLTVNKGDTLDVVRAGAVIGEVTVSEVNPPDKKYPNGSIQVQRGKGAPQPGDDVHLRK
jgi:tetratricopeptide (TPR) repeat protein